MVALETSKVQLKTEINNRRISKITRNKINNLVIHIYICARVYYLYMYNSNYSDNGRYDNIYLFLLCFRK